MNECLRCGRTAPTDPDTGYSADSMCPDCERADDNDVPETRCYWQTVMCRTCSATYESERMPSADLNTEFGCWLDSWEPNTKGDR